MHLDAGVPPNQRMTALDFVWVGLAGSVGAVARYLVDGWVSARWRGRAPVGTILINVTGSLLLGVFVGLVAFDGRTELWKTVAGTGFCGGYTTFSTASVETVRLIQDRTYRLAVVSGGGTLLASVGAAAAGMLLSQV